MKFLYHEVHEESHNLISLRVLRALRGDILPRMLCPSEFRDGYRPVDFAQSPSPDWAKQIFSANSASLRLLLKFFTAEVQVVRKNPFSPK